MAINFKYILPPISVGFILLFYAGNFYLSDKVTHGAYITGANVSGMTKDGVDTLISSKSGSFLDNDIVFRINKPDGATREVPIKARDLGISINPSATAAIAYQYGRSGRLTEDITVLAKSFFTKHEVDPVANIDFSKLSQKVDEITAGEISPARDATITYEGEVKVVGDKEGTRVNKVKLAQDLRDRVNGLSGLPIDLKIDAYPPFVSKEQTAKALDKVKRLNNQRVVLAFGSNNWKISGNTLLSILKFYPKGMENGYSAKILTGDSSLVVQDLGNSDRELEVSVNGEYIKKFVGEISQAVDQNKVDATLVFEGGKVKQFIPAQDGQKLDADLTFKLISAAVSVDNLSAEHDLVINLPVRVVKAKIDNDEINSLGIKEQIGRGVSYFAGSIPNRAYNVSLGAGRINGTIVKSGDVFSFNKSVGEVSGATGYKQAYVISSGRTVLDDGGGICQVSTTVFRAALNAGLPIVSRTAHAYRVGYYEQHGSKAGMDATVFSPSVDFAFKNDTDHSILVQTVVDASSAKLEVSIYGTSDGRKVEISDPVVSNIVPAPPDVFQDDPTLPKGTKKQVDFSAQGATSVFSRKVFNGDRLLIDESFKSVYRPWQAVYLVGTGG